jgi:beta-lactamase regulating signal transducer with metallopeptidase domain
MPLYFSYLIKLSVAIAVLYIFYQLVLRRLTFYNWNRWYLLIYTFLAFIIPFINISPALEKKELTPASVFNFVPVIENYTAKLKQAPIEGTSQINIWMVLQLVFFSGFVILLMRLGIHYISLLRLRRSARVLSGEGIKIYQVDKNIIPFSFGGSIFINQQLHNETELKDIIRHEFIHVREKHTVDIVWCELFCALNWYNPFAWLIRKAVRQNLEFIADDQVLYSGIDKKQYQYLLLKVMGSTQFNIASQFNFSSLKKRIVMMNKIKSAKVHLLKFLFILPLMAILLLAFRNKLMDHRAPVIKYVAMIIDADSKQPIEGVKVTDVNYGQEAVSDGKGYYSFNFPLQKNMEVVLVFQKKGYVKYRSSNFSLENHQVTASLGVIELNTLKKGDGADCADCESSISLDELKNPQLGYNEAYRYYQDYLESKKSQAHDKNVTWNFEQLELSPDSVPQPYQNFKSFLRQNPDIRDVEWKSQPLRILIHLKNGKYETYNLEKKEEVEIAERKYGMLPQAPAPPPQGKSQVSVNFADGIPEVKEPGVWKIKADTLSVRGDKSIYLSGHVEFSDNDNNVRGDDIEMKFGDDPLILVNGKETSLPALNISHDAPFELTIMEKNAGIKKYGDRGKNGVIEIRL